jgi:AraC family transcriptional regulator
LAVRDSGIWDGKRPLLPRDIIARTQVRIGEIGVIAASENLSRPTDWTFEEPHHTIVVHLGGQLDSMDCEFSVGPSGAAIPMRGDIWMIPAGCRYAALAQGERAEFVEFNVPTALLGDASLVARVRHEDNFLFAAAERLSELVRFPEDHLAQMAARAIAEAMQLHLLLRYGAPGQPSADRLLNSADQTMLADTVHQQLDAQFNLETLAAMVDMKVRPFTSAFKAAFGVSPWQYVLRARLSEAARLLRKTDLAVTEIALIVGFASHSHFTTAFTRRFGVSPSAYRVSLR